MYVIKPLFYKYTYIIRQYKHLHPICTLLCALKNYDFIAIFKLFQIPSYNTMFYNIANINHNHSQNSFYKSVIHTSHNRLQSCYIMIVYQQSTVMQGHHNRCF